MSEKQFRGEISDVETHDHELSEEEIIKETLKYEEKVETIVDIEAAPSIAKAKEKRGSGSCNQCGRYFDVPIINGVPMCACNRK